MEQVPRKGVKFGSDLDNHAKGPWDPPKGPPAKGECFAPCQILQPRASAHDFDEHIDFLWPETSSTRHFPGFRIFINIDLHRYQE